MKLYQHITTEARIADVKQGRDTLEHLRADKVSFECHPLLAEVLKRPARSREAKGFREYYGGICEAVSILEQSQEGVVND